MSVGYKMSQQKWDFFGVEGTALRRLEERFANLLNVGCRNGPFPL
jgi:hypothetical protein